MVEAPNKLLDRACAELNTYGRVGEQTSSELILALFESERQIEELRAQSDRYCDKYLAALKRAEAAEAEIARLKALPLKDERHLTPDEQKTFDVASRNSGTVRQVLPLKDEVERVLEEAKAAISSLSGGPDGSCSETIRRLDSSLSRLRAGEQQPTHRHKKRGTGYVLLGFGRMQANNWRDLTEDQDLSDGCEVGKPVDMREVAIYRSVDDGSLWTRPREEFEDGRFEALPAASSEHGGERE